MARLLGADEAHGKCVGHAVLIAGPTASGKSALALDIAREFDGVVINADSMQVYRELRVVTARPSAAEEAAAPHRLYGVAAAAEALSAPRWRDMAAAEIAAAWAAGRLPVVVGGTGLYLRTLTEGIAPIPDVPLALRDRIAARREAIGAAAFHAELARIDPAVAGRVEPGDSQRAIRAMAVHAATGTPLSEWHRLPATGPILRDVEAKLVLAPPRDALYARIDRRFETMLDRGALAEVEALMALDLDPALPACKALGVPELTRYLRGEWDLETAVGAAQQASRRYAKRQSTWFRNQMAGAHRLDAQYSESLSGEIFSFIRRILLTVPT
ncbi:tRNA (adenosine(37)-N6)-dimethylallyltransferase MiaA [Oceanibacterium hippocampi]|uniref:tRNA dimethylallyltransferase n=1 Tax=Oceanibacterium hippocampi TaxID=745714 RepID=A0A1Y5TTS1_9PROT|nr:tRNA (adenosine(37)-N6)-dimethylallyltransferase MiaA [Oceanibacterium hippocampi]SLN72415.1 tRNA dimethylallyltransferase [Oceanibacterium hippocampi]